MDQAEYLITVQVAEDIATSWQQSWQQWLIVLEWFDVVLPNWLTGEAVDVAPAFKNRAQLRAGIKKKHVLSLPVSYSNWSRATKEVEKSYKEIHFAI